MSAKNPYDTPAFVVEELTKAGVENESRIANLWSIALRMAGARICSPLDALTAMVHLANTQCYSNESIQAFMDHLIGAGWAMRKTNDFFTYLVTGKEGKSQGISWAVFYMFIEAAVKSANTTPATSHPLAHKWKAWAFSLLPSYKETPHSFSWKGKEPPSYRPPWHGLNAIRGIDPYGKPYTQADVLLNNGELPDTVLPAGAVTSSANPPQQETAKGEGYFIIGGIGEEHDDAEVNDLRKKVETYLIKVRGLSPDFARSLSIGFTRQTLNGQIDPAHWDMPADNEGAKDLVYQEHSSREYPYETQPDITLAPSRGEVISPDQFNRLQERLKAELFMSDLAKPADLAAIPPLKIVKGERFFMVGMDESNKEQLNALADAIPQDVTEDDNAIKAFLDAVGAVEVQNTWADIPEDMDVSYNEYSAMVDRVVLWLTEVKGLSVELARRYAGSLAAKTLRGELSPAQWDIPIDPDATDYDLSQEPPYDHPFKP